MIADDTVAAFENYDVLSKRELESRYEVWVEQYAIRANIEAETADSIAKTMMLPAALRYLALIAESGVAEASAARSRPARRARRGADGARGGQRYPDGLEGLDLAIYARDNQLAAMADVREAADKLEKVVADDLWPLPKYSEMLFIK